MNRNLIGTMAVLLLAPAVVLAFDWPAGRGGRKGAPPEAIEACKGKTEGDAVEFTTPRGDKVTATCKLADSQLVAVPEGGFRGQKGAPPSGMQNGQ